MVEITASPSFLHLLSDLRSCDKLSSPEEASVLHDEERKIISLSTLRLMIKHFPEKNLHQEMKGAKLSFPSFRCEEMTEQDERRAKKLKERKDFLCRQRETREYNRMVFGSDRLPSDNEETISNAIKSVKYQMAISSNMLAAMAGAFGAAYYSAQKFMEYTKNQCMIAGLVAAIAILIIEMVLYIIRAHKMEKIQVTESKKTDSKMKIAS